MPEPGTLQQIVDQLVKPAQEYGVWQGHSLTFSFSNVVSADDAGNPESATFSPFSGDQRVATRLVMAAFSDVIDMQFTEVAGQQGNAGDIRFANFDGGQNTAFAHFPGSGLGGDIFVSITPVPDGWPDLTQPASGNHAFLTYLHEMGHAMGLGHPGNYNGGSPSWAADALFAQDTEQFSVMSYFQNQDAGNGSNHSDPSGVHHFAQTLMLYDIAALQAIYGANLTTRAGATVYGFNSTIDAGSPYDFAANPYPVVCIYDAGGRDRIDFSGFSGPTRINLAPGSFSDTQDLAQNVSIAYGTIIENATGGSAADAIFGNRVDNALQGGRGNDVLSGLVGADLLRGGAGNDRLTGGLGNDTLTGGSGADTFVLSPTVALAGVDVIVGFNHADDRFRLIAGPLSGLEGWTADKFFAGTSGRAHDASDRIIYDTDTGKLYYDADGNALNGVAAVQIAILTNRAGLDWTDFGVL